jgi:hypothetical protein
MSGRARLGDAGLGCVGLGVVGSIGQCGVGRVARGRTGGLGGAGARAGSFGWARGVRLVGWLDRWILMMNLWSITLGDE